MAVTPAVPRRGSDRRAERIGVRYPVRIAAIDAGSNAIRLVIAETRPGKPIEILKTERWAVRLGHGAFSRHRLDREKISSAVRAFRECREFFDEYEVECYRAVATSAAREAANSETLVKRVLRDSGIQLEIIGSEEEARLVRTAVTGALGKWAKDRLVLDLGGGSLELCLMSRNAGDHTVALPLGTVRLLETFGLSGAIKEEDAEELEHYIWMMLESYWPDRPELLEGSVVACGGNAEALARLFPGPRWEGVPTLNLRLLKDRLWSILRLGVGGRMDEFRVRRDRAEVMGVAAITVATVGSWLRLRSFLIPGVGVKEGILRDFAAGISSGASVRGFSALSGAHPGHAAAFAGNGLETHGHSGARG